MGLKLENHFTVAAPVEETWATLLDIARVARCMPGATIEPGGEDGIYRGTMKVKLGPMNVAYKGTVRLAEVDVDTRVCTLDVKAKEQRGQGTASATITNRLAKDGSGTKVVVETDLAITGRQAQFGRGIMEDVSAKMLADFAQRLEREVITGSANGAGQAAAAPAAPPTGVTDATAPATTTTKAAGPAPADAAADVLDLGDVVSGPLAKRAGVAAAATVAVSALIWLVTRRRGRKGFELQLRYR